MITTKKVSEISEKTFFFIPEYQRGYKWTKLQVEELLSDIMQFEKTTTNNLNQSYCLQPIVLDRMDHNDKRLEQFEDMSFAEDTVIYELIDGQQRLTTLYLILSFLNNRFKPEFANKKFQLFYETRPRSYKFLQDISEHGLSDELKEDAKDNIDFHHIYQAFQVITKYFTNEKDKKDINLFESILLFRTKFIWYEIDQNESSTANEIFKRLNSGKIELTNAELIKALFLGNYENSNITEAERMQMSIEWEWIENKLNNDEFWYFLTNTETEKNNRISFILDHFATDLDSNGLNNADKRYSFLLFNKLFQKEHYVKETWDELKQQFRIVHNWFSDFELFHYIGFLLTNDVGKDLGRMFELYEEADCSIDEFKILLLTEIDEEVNQQEISDLRYNQKNQYHLIRKVLLWFNISMIVNDKNRNHRFNFYKFKDLKFDVEHIKSLDSEITKSDKSKKEFMYSFFNYYADQELKDVNSETDIVDNEYKGLLIKVFKFLKKSDSEDFILILNEIKQTFEIEDLEFESKEDHSIGNLCLLDQGTNRGYKNAIFPIKRQTIIDNDLQGIYILPMTKSAFLKQFNGRSKNLLVWTDIDSQAHKEQIIDQLK